MMSNNDNLDDTQNSSDNEILYAVLIDEVERPSIVEEYALGEAAILEEPIEVGVLEVSNGLSGKDEVVVNSFQERRQKQFISQSRSKKQWLLITACIALALSIISIGLLESPLYSVKQIEISSTDQDPINRLERMRLNELIKTANGQPMYRNNFVGIEQNIEQISSVASVNLEKSWPNTLKIAIVKRQPVGYIETDRGFALVDEKGFVFSKVEDALPGYPSFAGLNTIEFARSISDKTFVNVMREAPSEIQNQIIQVKVENSKYSLELTAGINVELGDSSDLKTKLAITWSILQAKKRSDIRYIDVSVPSLPVSGSPELKV